MQALRGVIVRVSLCMALFFSFFCGAVGRSASPRTGEAMLGTPEISSPLYTQRHPHPPPPHVRETNAEAALQLVVVLAPLVRAFGAFHAHGKGFIRQDCSGWLESCCVVGFEANSARPNACLFSLGGFANRTYREGTSYFFAAYSSSVLMQRYVSG